MSRRVFFEFPQKMRFLLKSVEKEKLIRKQGMTKWYKPGKNKEKPSEV